MFREAQNAGRIVYIVLVLLSPHLQGIRRLRGQCRLSRWKMTIVPPRGFQWEHRVLEAVKISRVRWQSERNWLSNREPLEIVPFSPDFPTPTDESRQLVSVDVIVEIADDKLGNVEISKRDPAQQSGKIQYISQFFGGLRGDSTRFGCFSETEISMFRGKVKKQRGRALIDDVTVADGSICN